MKYLFMLTPGGPGFMVTFPRILQAISYGETKTQAIDF